MILYGLSVFLVPSSRAEINFPNAKDNPILMGQKKLVAKRRLSISTSNPGPQDEVAQESREFGQVRPVEILAPNLDAEEVEIRRVVLTENIAISTSSGEKHYAFAYEL